MRSKGYYIYHSQIYPRYLYIVIGNNKDDIAKTFDIDNEYLDEMDSDVDAMTFREVENKVLVYGIMVLICGGCGVLETQTGLLGRWYLAVIAIFLAVTFWFAFTVKKSAEKYWPTGHTSVKK